TPTINWRRGRNTAAREGGGGSDSVKREGGKTTRNPKYALTSCEHRRQETFRSISAPLEQKKIHWKKRAKRGTTQPSSKIQCLRSKESEFVGGCRRCALALPFETHYKVHVPLVFNNFSGCEILSSTAVKQILIGPIIAKWIQSAHGDFYAPIYHEAKLREAGSA
ncbi:hypothetical protein U1Q18_004925, partial [Sarracenia purpurea var. burkii]